MILIAVLLAAAALGNTLNYQIGRYPGRRFSSGRIRVFLQQAALTKTHLFYETHGGKTLVISRFLPLFRTFAPFVAGIGAMTWARFTFFNLIGAFAWVVSLTLAGYFFGNLPWVQKEPVGRDPRHHRHFNDPGRHRLVAAPQEAAASS